MSWAARRRFYILLIVGGVIVAIITAVLTSVLYKAPSCVDGVQNQNERGIDCGGLCPYLCTADEQPPTVLSTRAIANGAGRADVLAYVENKNAGTAARAVPYTLTLYGTGQALIQQVSGVVDLPPSSTVPIYVPGVASGKQVVVSAFLTIDPADTHWFSYFETRTLPLYDNDAILTNAATAPRVTATLSNSSALQLENVRAVVAILDSAGNVIAASETLLPSIPGQGRATAVFTWNQPFKGVASSFEVMPVVALP